MDNSTMMLPCPHCGEHTNFPAVFIVMQDSSEDFSGVFNCNECGGRAKYDGSMRIRTEKSQ